MVLDIQEEDGDEETAAEAAEQPEQAQQEPQEKLQQVGAEAAEPAAVDPAEQASRQTSAEQAFFRNSAEELRIVFGNQVPPPAERKVMSKFADRLREKLYIWHIYIP